MKRIFFIIILFVFSAVFTACSKEKDLLTDNKWRLVGFVDAETETIKEVYPTDDWCYTLTFKKNGKCSGSTSSNTFEGKYKINYNKHSIHISTTRITVANEWTDGNIYAESLFEANAFSIQEDKLKLYYNNKQNYLLYKSQEL